jgi:hypothetical protein
VSTAAAGVVPAVTNLVIMSFGSRDTTHHRNLNRMRCPAVNMDPAAVISISLLGKLVWGGLNFLTFGCF